jgi:hypothetical protein
MVARELHGEGFFSDLKDKIGMWLFKNVHPVGRLSSYVQGKGFSNNLRIHKGFPNNRIRPLSSYPPHIIAGALHIVKNMRRNRPNQNEYNREQAHHLLQQTLHGEGFFSDLKDKIGMWLFKNVHPVGRLSSFVQSKS